jgi:FMN phosphatase YigB (HAD superfamily)
MGKLQNIKNLVFDIGDVIIDIDYNRPGKAFQPLAKVDFSDAFSFAHQDKIFDKYERGDISSSEFRDGLRKYLKDGVTDEQIDAAWNTIFVDFPADKFELLLKLKGRYNTCALSNINDVHLKCIDKYIQTHFGRQGLASYFNTAYYSHEMGYRKPEEKIYKMLLEKENINPAETFFIDDRKENVEAATALGIQAFTLTERDNLVPFLTELGIL